MSENETQLVTLLVPKSLLGRFDASFVNNKPTTRADVIRGLMERELFQVEPDFKPDTTNPDYITNRRNELRNERNNLMKEQERIIQRLDNRPVKYSNIFMMQVISNLFSHLGYNEEDDDRVALLKKLRVYEIGPNDRFSISDLEDAIELVECWVRRQEIDKELHELRMSYIKSKKKP